MIVRYFIFIAIIILSIFIAMLLVKETGEERKGIEKLIKAKSDEKLRASQEVWRQGPKKRR